MNLLSPSLRMLPVSVNARKVNAVRFGMEPLRPQDAAAAFVTRFEAWASARQIQVRPKTGNQFQLLTPERTESVLSTTNPGQVEQRQVQDNNTFTVPGEWARRSTAPRVYELSTENTGETLTYAGPGCFSLANAAYRNAPNAEPLPLEGELLARAESLIYRLAALTGEQQ
jgi:hypothetical protein